MRKFDGDGQYRVAGAHELQTLTLQGWKLVFSYQDTTHQPYRDREIPPPGVQPQPYYGNDGYHEPGIIAVTRFKPNSVTHFVLFRDENTVIADLQEKLRAMEGSLSTERTQHQETKKSLETLEKDHQILKKNWEFDARAKQNIVAERDQFRVTYTKLEADLAKVRQAIGERAFNEIISPPPKA